MTLLLVPMPSGNSGLKERFNYYYPDELIPTYANLLREVDVAVNTLKQQNVFYAKEAEDFVRHIKELIRDKSLHHDLHQNLYNIVQTARNLFSESLPIGDNKVNPKINQYATQLGKQMQELKSYRNCQTVIGVTFLLLTAIVIAAAITIPVMIPALFAAIFAPIMFGLISVKPGVLSGFSFNDAYKAHGIFKKLNPLMNAVNIKTRGSSTPF